MKVSQRVGGLAVAICLGVGSPATAYAEDRGAATEFALGAGSFAATAVWGSAKVVYAVGGTVIGGLAWVLSGGRTDVARAIVQPAVRGDYIVTPDHLLGRRPISFIGRDPETGPYPY